MAITLFSILIGGCMLYMAYMTGRIMAMESMIRYLSAISG